MSLIGKSIGNYQITAKLGEGGMGAVYLGEHPLIGKRVAIKVLLEELSSKQDIVQRFFTEAKAVNDIGHPNIVDIVDFGKVRLEAHGPETVYLVMEYLDGESLSGRIRRAGLTVPETMRIMAQCCSALAASHAKGIVHRDLKPENIFLLNRPTEPLFVKILDFGIAKLTGEGGVPSSKTRTGLVIGTPAYMSPEQCEGRGHVDHRSDVYALGVVMFELLTGRVPFPGEGFGEILMAQMTKAPPPPSSLNPMVSHDVEAIVLHALQKDRNARFQTMDEFAAAIANPAAYFASWRSGRNGTNQMPVAAGYGAASAPTMVPGRGYPTPVPGAPVASGVPRPTTLSGSAGQVGSTTGPSAVMPRRGNGGAIAAVVALVLAAGGAGGYFLLRGQGGVTAAQPHAVPAPDPKDKTKDEPPVKAPAEPEDVAVMLRSDPSGATVQRAGADAPEGTTPLKLTLKRGSEPVDVRLTLAGHKAATRQLATDRDQTVIVPLERDSAAPVAAADPKPAPTAKPAAHSSSSSHSAAKKDKPKAAASGSTKKRDDELIMPSFLGGAKK